MRICDCGQEARLGGYCSKQCELKSIVLDHDGEEDRAHRWPSRRKDQSQHSRRVQDNQYHGHERADDI